MLESINFVKDSIIYFMNPDIQNYNNSGVSWNDEESCTASPITKPPSKPTIDSTFIDSFLVTNNEDPFLKYIESVSIPKTLSTDELVSLQNAFSATLIEGKKKTEVLLAFSKDGMFYLIIEKLAMMQWFPEGYEAWPEVPMGYHLIH